MAGCGLADRADQVARPRLGSLPRDTRTAMQKVRKTVFPPPLRVSLTPHTRANVATIGCTRDTGSQSTGGGAPGRLPRCRTCSTHSRRCRTSGLLSEATQPQSGQRMQTPADSQSCSQIAPTATSGGSRQSGELGINAVRAHSNLTHEPIPIS
jgi:hypothetical protein